jgi:hypothetical protein
MLLGRSRPMGLVARKLLVEPYKIQTIFISKENEVKNSGDRNRYSRAL